MKKCISLWLAIVLLFSFINIPVFAEEKKEGQIYFSYTDVETGEKVNNDQALTNGKIYRLSVEMAGFKDVYSFQIALHFNNKTVKLIDCSDFTEIEDGVIPEDYEIYNKGVRCVRINPNETWKSEFVDMYPYFSNKEGLIKLLFTPWDVGSEGADWNDRAEIFNVTFKTIANGNTDFRPATKDDEFFDATVPNGFMFTKTTDATGDYWMPTIEERGERDVCTPISSIELSPKTLSVIEGETEKLDVKLNDGSSVSQLVWTVDNPDIASVSQDGSVSGIMQGKTVITASNDNGTISDNCEVTVINPNFPTIPQNLHIEEKTGKSVSLAWSQSTGRKGVTGYKIYKDGKFVANTTDTKFSESGLNRDTEYKYTVSAYYQNADVLYESEKSAELSVVPKAPVITSVKPVGGAIVGGNGKVQVKVFYGNDFNGNGTSVKMEYLDYDDEVYHEVAIEPESIRENGENGFSFYPDFTKLTIDGENDFRFKVTDKDGFSSEYVTVTYGVDTQPPSKINNFKATNNIEREIYLSWDRAKEIDTAGYYLYKYDKDPTENNLKKSDAAKITINGIDIKEYTDKEVEIDKEYYYQLSAFDNFGLESELTSVVTGKAIEDKTAPSVLSILPASTQKLHGTENELSVNFYDNVKTTRAELEYYNEKNDKWTLLETKAVENEKTSFIIDSTKLDKDALVKSDDKNIDGILKIRVKAYDAAGNFLPDDKIEPIREYKVDNTAPDAPKDINGEVKDLSATIRWNEDFMSKSDFGYFIVEQKKTGGGWTQVGGNIKDAAGLIVENLEYGTQYIYRVKAVDDCGNMSAYSDELPLTTKSGQEIRDDDSENPIVVDIQPASGMLKNGSVTSVVVKAKDNIEVARLQLQYNIGEGWKDLSDAIQVTNPSSSVTVNKEIEFYDELKPYEGWIKVRAVAYDQNGNRSVMDSNTVCREYGIDRTAPTAPNGLSAALSDDGSVYIKWDVMNDDLDYYIVERSETEDFANAETVRDRHRKVSCYDDTAEEGKSYYYRVCAVDNAGNKGKYAVTEESVAIPFDNNPPEIISIKPENNSYINNDKNIVVVSKDQSGIKSVLLEYSEDGNSWSKYGDLSSDIASFKSIGLKDGQYKFRATITDKKDNSAVSDVYTYVIDNTAPVIKNANAQTKGDDIIVTWDCADSKLYKQSVYYKTQTGSYTLTADRAPNESGSYEAVISDVEKYNNTIYSVKITAEDEAGNISERIIEDVKFDNYTKDTISPVISAVIPSVMIVGQEEYFDASKSYDNVGIKDYTWKFGNAAPVTVTNPKYGYTFNKTGRYTVKLTVQDFAGNKSELTAKVKVVEKTDVKTLNLKIIDDTGVPVPNADVILGYGTENSAKYKSDTAGRCSIKLSEGAYCIGVYQDGYLPASKTVNIYKNNSEEVIRLVKQNIVIGELTWHRMTLKEIEESGIDASDVDNNNVFEYKISLIVGGEEVKASGVHVRDEKEHKPIVIDRTYSASGRGTVNSKIYWFDFTEDGDFNGGDYSYNSENDKDKKPKAFIAYIETPGTASWLKEFFDVQLVVENQALPEFVLKDCTAALNIDSGLSVAESAASGASSEKTVELGDIAGQKTASARWILRGDKEGTYDISADFNGYFESFDKDVSYTFESKEPIRVYGTDGLRFVVECEDEISDTDDYMLRIGLKNSGGVSRYQAKVELSESEALKAVDNYHNYIERENSTRYANDDDTLKLSETIYSNYAVSDEYSKQLFADNKIDKAKLKGLVMQWLGGNVNLPVEVRTAKIRSFHNRNIEVFYKHDDGTLEPFNALQVYGGDMNIVIKTSETLPGKIEAQSAANVDIYLDNNKIGTTDENGTLEYVYNADPGNEKQKAVTLTFKGNRTEPYTANLQIINNKANVSGYVYDELGNPLINANVRLAQLKMEDNVMSETAESVLTDRRGYFKLNDMYDSGAARITVSKNGYQTVTEDITLTSGDVSLSYNLKRISVKPKVLGVGYDKIGKIQTNKVVIPQGLNLEETISVNAEISSGSISGYIMKIIDESDKESIYESESNKFPINFKNLKAGDRICVYAKNDAGAVSAPYYLPITVADSPFVKLFNNNSFYTAIGIMRGLVSFNKLYDGAWLEGSSEESEAWNELLAALKQKYYIQCGGGYAGIDSSTDIDIDLFAYKNFPVTFTYNFTNGRLKINPMFEISDRTGYFKFNEEITNETDLRDGRLMWLTAWNGTGWGLSGDCEVDFTLGKDNKWHGNFILNVDEDKEYNGTYYRVMQPYEYIFEKHGLSEVLTGTWNKTMTADTLQRIALTQNGVRDADDFTFKYNTTTQGSWQKGNRKVSLCSNSTNNITMLPNKSISGHTKLIGDYSILGWKQVVNESYNHTFARNTFALQSAAYDLFDNVGEAYEPVALASIGGGGGNDSVYNAGDKNTIKADVFANAEIEAKNINGQLTAFYLGNGEGRAAVDSSKLTMMKYNNGEWTDESWLPIDDGTADYNPSVAQIKDGMAAVWTNAGTTHENSDGKKWTADDVADAAKNMEICVSVYDGKGWSQQKIISNTGTVNYSPVVTSYNGGAVAAWIVNDQNELAGSNADRIMYSVYSDGKWSDAETLPIVNGAISDISIKEYDGKLYVLYGVEEESILLDADGNPMFKDSDGNAESQKLNKYKLVRYDGTGWTTEQRIVGGDVSDVYAEFAEINNKLQIFVLSGMEMYSVDAETKKVIDTVSFKDLRDALDVKLVQDGKNIALVWVSSGNDGPMLFATLYDQERGWSEAQQLEAKTDSNSVIKNIAPMFTNDGSLKVLYNRYKYTETSSSVLLCETNLKKVAEPEIISLTAANEKLMPNGTLEFNAEIKNQGIDPIDLSEYKLVLKNKDNSLTETALKGMLASGETYRQTVKWTWDTEKLPEGNIKLIGAVTANGNEIALSSAECKVSLKDIAVDEDGADYEYTDGKHRFTVTVENNGTVPTGKAVVSAKCGDEIIKTADGNSSYEVELSCGDTKALTFETDTNIIGKEIVVTAVLDDDETDKENNTASYTFEKKDMSTIRAKICEFNNSGTAEKALKDAVIKVEVNDEEWSGSTSDKLNDDKTADKSVNTVKSQNVNVTVTGENILDRTFRVNSFDDVLINKGDAIGVAIGDVFKDGRINAIDYCLMLQHYNSYNDSKYDFNGNGTVDLGDLRPLIKNIGMTQSRYGDK